MAVHGSTRPGSRTFVAIAPHGKIADLDQSEAIYLAPAGHGTWLAITQTTIQRRKMLRSDEEIPGQMALS